MTPFFLKKIKRHYRSGILNYPVYLELLKELSGHGDDSAEIEKILLFLQEKGQLFEKYEALVQLLDRHKKPHWVNYLLALEEVKKGISKVKSYPPNVWMDLSSVCNIECRFCKYTCHLLPKKFVALEEVKAIEWFKYIRLLNFSAGTGETLLNPKFVSIFKFVRSSYPHLHLSLLTNGLALNQRILESLAGELDALHVSMNASNERDYQRVIQGGNWKLLSANVKRMHNILKGFARPKITVSFVMFRWNVQKAEEYLEFAAEHGASLVFFHHFYPHYLKDIHGGSSHVLDEKFSSKDSLYFSKEISDEIMEQVRKKAKRLGVEAQIPVPFGSPQTFINYGMRGAVPADPNCSAPWMNMYLLWGIKSRREEITICCGLASDIGVYFDRKEIATKEGLRKVWNSPILQAYRRTVNGADQNPICKMCREVDRFNPQAIYPDQRLFFQYNNLPLPSHFA